MERLTLKISMNVIVSVPGDIQKINTICLPVPGKATPPVAPGASASESEDKTKVPKLDNSVSIFNRLKRKLYQLVNNMKDLSMLSLVY